MGVMQIPEEQRSNVRKHASSSLEKARDIACDLNETMSTGCAKYSGTDPKEVVEKVVPEEIIEHCGCFPANGGDDGEGTTFRGERSNRYRAPGTGGSTLAGLGPEDGHSLAGTDFEIRSEGSSPIANAVNGVERGMNRLVGDVFGDDNQQTLQQNSPVSQQMNMVGGGQGGLAGEKGRGVGGVDGGGLGGTENEDSTGRRVACGRKGERGIAL